MKISIRTQGKHKIISLNGELDLYNTAQLREDLYSLIDPEDPSIILDMAEMTYIDSSGIALITDIRNFLLKEKRNFGLINLSESSSLRRTALENLFRVYASLDELD